MRGKKVWKIYDVKTSTSLDERHIIETAFKVDTIKAKYPEVKIEAYIMYINKEYVLDKELDVEEFFITENVTSTLRHVQPLVDRYSRLATKVFEMNEVPVTSIGTKCSSPFDCEFKNHCWKNVPENSVFEISRLWEIKKFQMYDQGIVKLEDVPRNVKLNEKQWMQIDCTVQNRQIIDPVAIGRFLEKIEYPISAMDFETCQPIIPIYQKTKPYQHTPIQFSVHRIDSENSPLLHYEFLHDGGMREVRINFMNRLNEAVGETGTILVYNKKFEEARLKEIAKVYTPFKEDIDNIISRMIDLMEPFDQRYLYHPAQKGSASLKVVLPAWVPELSYKDLEIFGGASASEEF
ncbi:MAG: DUF2779 domain-containing protein [Sporocytophaga sp.]|nr:DUF2779 domain-containing protein [Sporocytophaga sp.]